MTDTATDRILRRSAVRLFSTRAHPEARVGARVGRETLAPTEGCTNPCAQGASSNANRWNPVP